MNFFQHLSLQRKQMLIITATSAVSLLLACAGFVLFDAVMYRQELVQQTSSLAEVVGNSCTAALDFSDEKTATQALTSLRGEPNIDEAFVFTRAGDLFAHYLKQPGSSLVKLAVDLSAPNHVFTANHLFLAQAIVQGNERLGTIVVARNLDELAARRQRYALIVCVVIAVSLLVAVGLSSRLQRVVSQPILDLARMTRLVATEKNYSARASRTSHDELGELVAGFNEMLEQIQQRDLALQTTQDQLEHRVSERTAELAKSLSLLNATLDSTADGILVVDLQGQIISYNKKFAEMWRLPLDLLSKMEDLGALQAVLQQLRSPEEFLAKVRQLYANPELESQDLIEFLDGRVFERLSKAQYLGQRCVGRVWSFRDISEQKHSEVALRESQALYSSLVEQMPTGVFRKDLAGRFVFVNSWFCRLKGLLPEEILGKTAAELVEYETAKRGPAAIAAVREAHHTAGGADHHGQIVRTGAQLEVDEEYPDEAGGTRHLHVLKSPIFDLAGKITGSQGIQFDVTQRRQAIEAVAVSELRFRSVWERSIEGMRLTDREGRMVDVNEAFCRLVQMPRSELVGRLFSVTYAGQREGEGIEVYRQRFDLGTITPRIESRVELWNHTELELEIASSFIESYPQQKLMLSLFRDVTERRRTEEELRNAQVELVESSRHAGMAEIATNVLHNVGNVLNSVTVSAGVISENLRASKAAGLQRVVALLDEHKADLPAFFANGARAEQVHHYLSLLGTQLGAEQQEVLGELQSLTSNIEHIKEIVAMQQSYARVSGVVEMQVIADLVEDALRMHVEGLRRHAVTVVREFENLPAVPVDKHKILQILINLITNAKYALATSPGPERILTLRIARVASTKIQIVVADNGVGIAPENLTRIFSHGFTTRRDGHGFGLHSGALAARQMGGALEVTSGGLGCGAVFTLELPVPAEGLIL